MIVLCDYVDPVTGERCQREAQVRAVRLEFGVALDHEDEVRLCRRHYDELWVAAQVGERELV